MLADVHQSLLLKEFGDAKMRWLSEVGVLPDEHGQMNAYGSETQYGLKALASIVESTTQSTCSNASCVSPVAIHRSPFPVISDVSRNNFDVRDSLRAWQHPGPTRCSDVDSSEDLPTGLISIPSVHCPGVRTFQRRSFVNGVPPVVAFSVVGLQV